MGSSSFFHRDVQEDALLQKKKKKAPWPVHCKCHNKGPERRVSQARWFVLEVLNLSLPLLFFFEMAITFLAVKERRPHGSGA
jgi:hypothetical protein